jgi:hypothetical protein
MIEAFEFLGYFAFFWIFVFSPKFRRARVEDWREGGLLQRASLVFECAVSFLIGVVVPLVLIHASVSG